MSSRALLEASGIEPKQKKGVLCLLDLKRSPKYILLFCPKLQALDEIINETNVMWLMNPVCNLILCFNFH